MTTTHTPGPWSIQRGNSHNPMVGTDAVSVAEVLDDVYPDVGQQEANARLIAACPSMLAELRETADWLAERATFLRDLAKLAGVRADRAQWLRDEAARFEGRATVIRQTILKATQGA